VGIAVSQLLARGLSYALIAFSLGKRYAFLAVLLEAGFYFLYKLIRQDFYYLPLNLSGFARFVSSCLARFTVKIIADFCCFMALRNPCELGGLYFSVNAMMSQAVLWGSIIMYIDKMLGEESDDTYMNADQLTKEILFSIGQMISSVWVVSVAVFFMTCKNEFIRTFIGTATSRTYLKECWDFQMSPDPRVADESIVKLFKKHPSAYKHFELEVGAFVSENWEKWVIEKPKFFTKNFVKSIPFSVLSESIRDEIIVMRAEQMRERKLTEEREEGVGRGKGAGTKWKNAFGKIKKQTSLFEIMK
jgi:hypothetical protein